MKRHCFTSYPLFALIGLILSPLATVHAAPPPADSVPKCTPFDYEQWRRDHPRPASKRLADLDVGEPRTVRMIYFLPKGRPYDAALVDTMKTMMLRMQTFFAERMEGHGHGHIRFRFEADAAGEPRVHRVDGKRSTSYYNDLNTVDKVLGEIDPVFDIEANVYYITIDNGNACMYLGDLLAGGVGSRWTKNGGFGMVPGGANFGTAAHELGHALGLSHDFRDDAYVMSYGYIPPWLYADHQLSACNAEFLAVHPYFNPNSPIGEGSSPTIEENTSSPITVGVSATGIPVRIKVRDSDGLHQVILKAETKEPHFAAGWLEVKACRGLEGKRDPAVEFDYDGVVPSLPESDFNSFKTQSLRIQAIDASGNVAWSEAFELVSTGFREPIATFFRRGGFVASVIFSPDGRLLAAWRSSYTDRMIEVWDVSRGESIATLFFGGRGPVSFSPNGRLLALEASDRTIELWDVSSGKLHVATAPAYQQYEESPDNSVVSSLSFSPDGKLLASGGRFDYLVKLWDTENGELITTVPKDNSATIASVSFSPDGRLLAWGSLDGTIKLWDVSSRKYAATLLAHEEGGGVSFSPDGKLLASAGRTGSAHPTGTTLGETEQNSEIKLWDVSKGRFIATLFGSGPVSFSPDGKLLASASAEKLTWLDQDGVEGGLRIAQFLGGNQVKLWDAATGEPVATLPKPLSDRTISVVVFSPDGKRLAQRVGAEVRLWDVSEWAGRRSSDSAIEEAMPHSLTKVSGDGQEGTVGEPLAKPFVVSVLDQNGAAFAGAVVTFSVTAGGGALSPTTATTDANGRARSTLTLGSDPETNTVTATVAGLEPVTFTAKGQATTDSDSEEDDGEPQAWLTPDPAEVQFYADDPAWKTFTVHTNLDSVLVHANPSGSDLAIEVEGGARPPTREYCPAEGNDRPRRGRRDGYNLHVKACQAGQTKILLIDYDTGAVLQQYEIRVEASTSAAATTALNPSYPNPFNSETVLSYTLPTASAIRLEVFTLNGQRVAVLHEGFQAAGYHTIALDASALASGVYLYRLTTPEGRFVQKFTLLR